MDGIEYTHITSALPFIAPKRAAARRVRPHDVYPLPLTHTHLPDPDDGVGDQDQEDDEGLHKGRDGLLVVLEKGQNLGKKASLLYSLENKYTRCKRSCLPRLSRPCLQEALNCPRYARLICPQSKRQRCAAYFMYPHLSFQVIEFPLHKCLLTNEMIAASSKILTRRSSNCSRTSCQRDFPSSAGSSGIGKM